MEKLPAVYRVPTELWHEIFSHILKTWLLPGSGDNVFDNIFLFSHGYKSRAEYSRFESDRRKLGAVCRHWKAVADDFALNMVFTNFGKSAPISKERLDLSQRIEVANGCLCSQHPFKLCVILPIQHGRDGVTACEPVLDSPFSLEHVQVISSGAPTCFGRFIDAKYINSAPKLRALGVQVDSLKGVTSLDSLTHLSIGDTSGREMLGTISLPRLRSGLRSESLETFRSLDISKNHFYMRIWRC
ncbi:hypothetical protein FRC14_002436 [Serendipita sp. 396]|nr:hypothetical protein FRC14_002436 [Serendipita sp. 396]